MHRREDDGVVHRQRYVNTQLCIGERGRLLALLHPK